MSKPCALLWVAALAACAEPPTTPEHVERLGLSGAPAARAVSAAGETRSAFRLPVPYDAELCLPQTPGAGGRAIELGVLAPGARVRARLGARYSEDSGTAHPARWTELRVALPRGAGCAELELRGPREAEALVSTPLGVRRGARRPWVVLYVIDTLRYDATSYGGASHPSPVWERLAADGIVYRRAFASSSWTRPSVASLLTGLGPSFHRTFDRQDRLPAGVPRLPQWLGAAGYATAAFSTNPNVLPEWGFLDGFDRFVDIDAEAWMRGQDFDALGERVLDFAGARSDRPLFLYVHDNQPHVPYRPSAPLRRATGAPAAGHRAESPTNSGDRMMMHDARRLYAGEVLATGERLGALLDGLERLGRRADAFVAVVGDHGEEFGEHGGLFHGRTLYQEQLHVPLVLKPPAPHAARGHVDAAVSIEDVAPTLLAWLGLPLPPPLAERRLPLPGAPGADDIVLAELDLDRRSAEAALRWPLKYLRDRDGRERLFDLEVDPGERSDLASARPAELARLRGAVEARRAAARQGLGIACVAGPRLTRVSIEIEADGLAPERVTRLGLEAPDALAFESGRLEATLVLRPKRRGRAGTTPTTEDVALHQPDRDGLRLVGPLDEASTLRLRSAPSFARLELEGPEGAPLEGGAPIALAALRSSAAPREPVAGPQARCRLHYLEDLREVLPEAELDDSIRRRLRALGYLE